MDPGVQWDGVSGGVPVLDSMLQPRQHHLLQYVLHLPGGQEGHPQLEEVDDGGKLQQREGGESVAELGHPDLPHKSIVRVHAAIEQSSSQQLYVQTSYLELRGQCE